MDFNTIIDRRGTHCAKWDMAQAATGIAPEDGLPMWVADSDYPTAPCVIEAARAAVEHGIFGYTHDATGYPQAIRWWMATRHGWEIDPDWIVTTNGLGHGIATVIDVLSEPGEGVAYFTPVYHEFHNKTQKSGRRPVPCQWCCATADTIWTSTMPPGACRPTPASCCGVRRRTRPGGSGRRPSCAPLQISRPITN